MSTNLEFIIDVEPEGGEPYRLICKSRVLGAWEQMFRGASLSNLEKPSVTDLQAIAFVGAVRSGNFEGNLNTFRETHEIDMKSELDIYVEEEREAEEERLRAAGETRTKGAWRIWEKRLRKESEDTLDSESNGASIFGGGPTP